MYNLFTIILKNFKLLIRNKSSALVVILGPLLLIFLIGMAFNNSSLYDLKLAVYTPSYSELTNSLLTDLKQDFMVVELDDEEFCVNGVKSGEYNVCAIIPANLKVGSKEEIVFYADYSRMNLVYNIISKISEKLDIKIGELSTNITSDLLSRLNDAKITLMSKKSIINSLKTNNELASTDLDSIKEKLNNLKFDDLVDENDTLGINGDVADIQEKINETILAINDVQENVNANVNDLDDVNTAISTVITATSSLTLTEAEDIVSPIKTRVEPISIDEAHLNYMFPSLLVLVVMLISILLASTNLINEKSTFAYFRNFITPTGDVMFLIGNFLSNLIIVILEIIVILGLSFLFFGQAFFSTVFIVLFILSLGAIVFILLGMIIGYSFSSGETANLAAISLASLMLFFSNTILPLETLPPYARGLAMLNPFVVLESMLKKVTVFGASLSSQALGILILIGYIMVFALLAYLSDEATKRRL